MKRIQIKKNDIVTNQVELPELEADAWLQEHLAMHSFGKPAVYETVYNETTQEHDQVLVTPAEEFEVVETDITAELEQNRINNEAESYLKSTDWMVIRFAEEGIPYPQEVKDARQAARQSIVK